MGAISANLLRTAGGTIESGQILLSGDEQSGADSLQLSGDMTDGDDCELFEDTI